MNVLIVGRGSGSWQMRGVQIGQALGARVTSTPSVSDWQWADVCLLVKHAGVTFAPVAHQYGVPIVWDVLDGWVQPAENSLTIARAIALIDAKRKAIKPAALIGATQAMADDIGGVYIPHHGRIGLQPTPARADVRTVAYDGSDRYLGNWRDRLERACQARGWRFVINPPDLAQADILVALRDGAWDGELPRRWKSGVKFVNALCAGRPILTRECAARHELPVLDVLVDGGLDQALHDAADQTLRHEAASYVLTARTFTAQAIADSYYRPLLQSVEASCISRA